MKRYLICLSLLLLLTAGCVGVAEPPAQGSPLAGVWVHDSGNPVFLFKFYSNGDANIVFLSIQDPDRPGYADVVTGRWELFEDTIAIIYTAPLSGNVLTLHLGKSGTFLVLTGASTADGSALNIEELEGIRFVRGESYSAPLMGGYRVDII